MASSPPATGAMPMGAPVSKEEVARAAPAGRPAAAWRRARRNSSAEAKRSPVDLARARSTTPSRAAGRPGSTSEGGRGKERWIS